MKRDIESTLTEWKNDPRRRPLLVRGARQVGKSFIIREFGTTHFRNIVEINFDQHPEYAQCFETLDPREITNKISIILKQKIESGQSLLFLDEIQECPPALASLRYFFEQMPDLHVIAAGSLLEFLLRSRTIEIPVGRIQYLFLKPMSFGEFLDATGDERLRRLICDPSGLSRIDEAIHAAAIERVRQYLFVGGMPAAVEEYRISGNLQRVQRIQTSIVQTYRDDFGKYANLARRNYLQKMFDAIPRMVGQKLKYSRVDAETPSRELKAALELLEAAGVVFRIMSTSAGGLPLLAGADDRHFKTIFLDVGLMQNICGIQDQILTGKSLLAIYQGGLTEQFVGQELLALQDPYERPALYYWVRENKGSSAEVDYLTVSGSTIYPVEVKSGTSGSLKSLHLFLKEKGASLALKISQSPLAPGNPVCNIPLYAIGAMKAIIDAEVFPFAQNAM
jgi:predicted AAA+ superfamily ATPase